MPRNAIAKKSIDLKTNTLTFDFTDGQKLAVKTTDFKPEILAHATLHGLAQVIGDAYAGSKTPAEAKMAAQERFNTLKTGEWSTRTGEGKPKETILALAIAAVKKIPVAEVIAKLEKSDDKTKKALRDHPQVKAAMADINAKRATEKAAKAKAGIDPNAALNF